MRPCRRGKLDNPTAAKATGNCIFNVFLVVVILRIMSLLSDILCFNEAENVFVIWEKKLVLIRKRNWVSEYCTVMYVVLYSCVVRIYYTNDSSFKIL